MEMEIKYGSLVSGIFVAKNLAVSIATYLNLIESVDAKLDKLISKEFDSAKQMLEQVRYITNPAIYSNMLIGIVDRFNQAIVLEKRERLLLSHLGLMMCYYYLGERNAFLMTQRKVSKLEFDTSFWEEYGGTIKQCGMVVLGIATAVLTGGNATIGAAMGGKSGNEMADDHQRGLEYRKKQYEEMKTAVMALRI